VIVPDTVNFQQNGSIYITGGSNSMGYPTASDEDITIAAAVAMDTSMVVGCLFQIPNEHVTFASDPELVSRTEGAIDAFTWVSAHMYYCVCTTVCVLLCVYYCVCTIACTTCGSTSLNICICVARCVIGPLPPQPVRPHVAVLLPHDEGFCSRHGRNARVCRSAIPHSTLDT
jgi:hypothetical protein